MSGLSKRQKILIFLCVGASIALILAAVLGLKNQNIAISPQAALIVALFAISLPLLLALYLRFNRLGLNKNSQKTTVLGVEISKNRLLAYAIAAVSLILVCFLAALSLGKGDNRTNLIVSSPSISRVYDGTALNAQQFEVLQGLKSGHSVTATQWASASEVGVYQNSFVVTVTDQSGNDITHTYNIEYRLGNLTITARPLTIISHDAQKEYDGLPLTHHSFEADQILSNHTLTVDFLVARTDAGSSANSFNAKITAGDSDLTHNYQIEKVFGRLSVVPRRINILTQSSHKQYDGTPLTANGFEIISQNKLLEGHSIEVVFGAFRTDAGVKSNSPHDIIITSGDLEVTHNYDIAVSEGDLVVSPRAITIRSGSASKVYDGTPLTFDSWGFSSLTTILSEHSITVIISGQRTALGASQNTISEVFITKNGLSVMHNYQVKLEFGTLAVTDPQGGYGSTFDEGASGSFGASGGYGGSGGGGGGGGGGLDDSGKIGLPQSSTGESEQFTVAQIKAYESATVYLRYMSFGDYTGSNWLKANDYAHKIAGQFSFNYANAYELGKYYSSGTVSIKPYIDGYLLPYYLDSSPLNYDIQVSDTIHSGDSTREYSLYAFLTDFLPQNPQNSQNLDGFTQYTQFVHENYLSMPAATRAYMADLITQNNFDISQADIIDRVASYIQNSASYNLLYDRQLDSEMDIAISFLRDYKEGVCQHYATAATMLFRALGLPARYTVGFVGNTQKNTWSDISSKGAHAWVEVFVEGFGWVKVEVTGSSALIDDIITNGSDSGSGSGSSGTLRIKPVAVYAPFSQGIVLTPSDQLQGLSALINKGFSYKATVSGSLSAVGIGYSEITSFELYDNLGKDVTKNYKILADSGILQLYLRELKITTPSHQKVYDGEPLTALADEFDIEGELLMGHSFKTLRTSGSQLRVGTSLNSCDIEIIDGSGQDVTDIYKITKDYGDLTVWAREIVVKGGSDTKVYDGTPLVCHSFSVESGYDFAIYEHDLAVVSLLGSQTVIGRSPNAITSMEIYDKNGFLVTDCYAITLIDGQLTVTPF